MTPLRLVLPAMIACLAFGAEARGQDTLDFWTRFQGGPYKADVQVTNDSCPGAHNVQITVQGAPWYRITGTNPVRVDEGATEFVAAELDTSKTEPGMRTGSITFRCLDCPANCKQSVTTVPIRVNVIPKAPFIEHALIQSNGGSPVFGGTVNGASPDICIVVRNILKDLGTTPWGQSSRGRKILDTLNSKYARDDCQNFKWVSWTETPNDKGVPQQHPDSTDDPPAINNAYYQNTNEIFVALDQRVSSIQCAKSDPSSYFLFTHKGKLGVARKSDLVHVLIHEGLHATVEGKENVAKPQGGRGASLEEEQDGANAGNEACKALGLPPTDDKPNTGYNAGRNPGYRPVQ